MKEIRARVISQERGQYRISCEGGERPAEVSGRFRYEASRPSDYPAVGDYVLAALPEDEGPAVISALFPRWSAFIRRAAGTAVREQVVAANVDTVFLCMSLNQDFNLRRLERYLAVSRGSGAEPVIVLTKADLCGQAAERAAEAASVAEGAAVLTVSSLAGETAAVLPYLTPGATIAFLGSSGVGKSTLINSLLGEDRIRTGEIRADDDKGRHTTTHRELLPLPCGAFVIDTPGMRELGMWDSDAGIGETFSDIESLACRCRYGDCTHEAEPGCAIRAALESGELPAARWRSYRRLKQENARTADEAAYLQAKQEKFKTIAKINRKRKH